MKRTSQNFTQSPEFEVKRTATPPDLYKVSPTTEAFFVGECSVFKSTEHGALHLSIAHPERYPTWDEISFARDRLLPKEKNFAMILPKSGRYINYHPNCFQLWECEILG